MINCRTCPVIGACPVYQNAPINKHVVYQYSGLREYGRIIPVDDCPLLKVVKEDSND